MKKNWWKFLTVALLLYTFIGGLKTPLSPGIYKVNSTYTSDSVISLKITGYNTNFNLEDHIQAWYFNTGLNKNEAICSNDITVLNDTLLKANFELLNNPERIDQHLFVQVNKNEILSYSSAFQITKKNIRTSEVTLCNKNRKELNNSFSFPYREQLYETIRNLFFHVPMWFTMMFMAFLSLIYSIKYLRTDDIINDIKAKAFSQVGLIFGFLGILTGSIWAKFTWGDWWVIEDVKLNGAAITVLIYLAYFSLRSAIKEKTQRAKLAAIYNIFAFVMMQVFIMVLPRVLDSLHPGNGGNPAFSKYDLDNSLRLFFYTGVIGWILLGVWITSLKIRIQKIHEKLDA